LSLLCLKRSLPLLGAVLFLIATALAQLDVELGQGQIDTEQGLDVYEGCSLGCALGWQLRVSSELPASAGRSYDARQLEDKRFETCWAEGVEGQGLGEFMEFRFSKDSDRGTVPFRGLLIKNGYTKSADLWAKNSRVKEFELSLNGKSKGVIRLADTSESQSVSFAPLSLGNGDVVRLTVRSVYPGSKYQDTCVSEILPLGAH